MGKEWRMDGKEICGDGNVWKVFKHMKNWIFYMMLYEYRFFLYVEALSSGLWFRYLSIADISSKVTFSR